MNVEINASARGYYDRLTWRRAVAYAREVIDEWSYEDDPHGYCHSRPTLVRLVEAAEELAKLKGVELP